MESLKHRLSTAVLLGTLTLGNVYAATLFVDDAGGFNTAISGSTFAGTEDWESSTLTSNNLSTFSGPLAPGVSNGPFPSGTNVATGLTVQENSNAGMPATTTAPGNLVTASAGLSGTPTDQVSTQTTTIPVSFDMLFGLANTFAVSFNPLVFDVNATAGAGLFNIRVFDKSNALIFSQDSINAAAFTNPTTLIGVVAMPGEDIGRINLFGTGNIVGGGSIQFTGADNISVYTVQPVPVPAAVWLFGSALFGMAGFRRQTRSS